MNSAKTSSTTVIALTRHGQTDWNAQFKLQGVSDIPLNDVGRGQASEAATRFASEEWHRVVTSPLSRAAETGRIIAEGIGLEVHGHYDELKERDYGQGEGKNAAELAELWPNGDYADMEERESVAARGRAALDRIIDDHGGQSVIVVAHGTLIREVLRTLTPVEVPPILNAASSVIEHRDGEWTVVTINDENHIEPSA
ncbi:histidine phosphatase family protein [Marisediminicola senii]|uniref:histidine phosphatase family protein n=1 Tax=Marisediminicola senii TaxID=2711233 RepID=UPI0013EB3518|nr:histidine phosphatase family protein [Marisediminicola senii]